MLTQEELLGEANRIIKEFQKYTKDFQVRGLLTSSLLGWKRKKTSQSVNPWYKIVDSFYHGTYGRCVRFSVVTTENESYRILLHQTGLSVLNDSSHFESFEQFFNSKSPNYRNGYSTGAHRNFHSYIYVGGKFWADIGHWPVIIR